MMINKLSFLSGHVYEEKTSNSHKMKKIAIEYCGGANHNSYQANPGDILVKTNDGSEAIVLRTKYDLSDCSTSKNKKLIPSQEVTIYKFGEQDKRQNYETLKGDSLSSYERLANLDVTV